MHADANVRATRVLWRLHCRGLEEPLIAMRFEPQTENSGL
jgi:hypothetical protein